MFDNLRILSGASSPFECLPDVGKMHLDAVLVLIGLESHLAEVSCLFELLCC